MKHRSRASAEDGFIFFIILIVVAGFLALGVASCSANASTSSVVGTIDDMYVKGGETQKFFIVVKIKGSNELEVLENRDALIPFGKTNSADIQQQARVLREKNATVRFELNGARWTLPSWYRNVLSMQEVK